MPDAIPQLGFVAGMHESIKTTSLLTTLSMLALMPVQAQPAFLRKDIQVPGQHGLLEIQVLQRGWQARFVGK